nr:putative lipoprotein [Leptospira interrogans str. L1207]
MTRINIQKFAWILFLLGFSCRTTSNDFDRKIYVVEGLRKQNLQEEKNSEKQKQPTTLNSPTVTINDRFEILDLTVSESLFKDVESKFGNQYIRNHFNYKEIDYEFLGLSFVFDNYNEKIREIRIKPPLRAITSRGITLDKSILQEARDTYGKAGNISEEYVTWNIEKKSYLCIRYNFRYSFRNIKFCVEKNPSIPENPVDKTFYLKQKIHIY